MNRARLAGGVYFLVFLTGGFALAGRGAASSAAGAIAGVLYIAVTLLFYGLFKPVSQRVSAIAAVISLAGIVAGPLLKVNPLPIFGVYCLLIGWLILRSTFVPRIVGGLMVFAGLGWLTFLSPSLAHALFPFNFAPGLIGEGSLTVWLLWKGRTADEWRAVGSLQPV